MIPKSHHPVAIVCAALLISAGMLLNRSYRKRSENGGATTPAMPGLAPASRGNQERSREPLVLLQLLARKTDPVEQSRAAIAMIDHLSPSDFPALLDRYRSMEPTPSADTIQLLLAAWTKVDPAEAARYAIGDVASLKVVIAAWSGSDPEAALGWITANASRDAAGPLLGLALPALATSDPARISKILSRLSEKGRAEVMKGFATALAQQGTGATVQWLGSINDPGWHYEALTAVIQSSSPDQAIEWMKRYSSELESRDYAAEAQSSDRHGLNVYLLFKGWESQDPDAANAAFEKLPPGTAVHHEALTWLVSNQEAKADPAAAVVLLDRFPGEVDDDILTNLIHTATWNDLPLAADLTLKLQGSSDDILLVLSRWMDQDLAAPRAWLEKHPIKEDLKPFLRKELLQSQ